MNNNFTLSWLAIFFTLCINAQGPEAPEAYGFEPVDASDMVNLLTGDLNYVLPLFEVPSPEGSFPISINYHGGISLNQEASWVGLGWNINPGVINRSINGVPDDWKEGIKSSIIDDAGGSGRTQSLSFGVGWKNDSNISIGGAYNWTTFRSVSGENSFNYNFNIGLTKKGSPNSANKSGYGVGISISDGRLAGGYLSYTNKSNETYTITNSKQNGLGLSIDTENFSSNIGVTGGEKNSYASSIQSYSTVGDRLSINVDFAIFNIGYSSRKFRIWTYDEKTIGATGSLHSGNFESIINGKVLPGFHVFDSNRSESGMIQDLDNHILNTPSYLAYDQYMLTGPGLSGTMVPRILDSEFLHQAGPRFSIENDIINRGVYQNLKLKHIQPFATHTQKNIANSNQANNINFYFENSVNSYYDINESGQWTMPTVITENIEGFLNGTNTSPQINQLGYESQKGRLVKGDFIEAYTNQQIINNPNLLLSSEIDRTNMDPDAIGGFKITDANGKTYYYAIPVLEKEKFVRISKLEDNYETAYNENQTLTPYATHWLLTAITGPDYVDVNSNYTVDENDYGYWIQFNYGKLSEGFGWRAPLEGDHLSASHKSYSWGVKELYYLNTIRTRTHTAIFVKDVRGDHRGFAKRIGTNRATPLYKYANFNIGGSTPVFVGTNGSYYFPGAYATVMSPPGVLFNSGQILVENWFYAESFLQNNVYLKRILLVKNEDLSNNSIFSQNKTSKIGNDLVSDFYFKEQVSFETGSTVYEHPVQVYEDKRYYGKFYDNLIMESDFPTLFPEDNSIKSAEFNYDYELAADTPNSSNSGRLTLKSVNILGKHKANLIPPYSFEYFNDRNYSQADVDEWGFNKYSSRNWSLKSIQTPIGAKIDIEYEEDDYSLEAGRKRLVFDDNLEAKFLESNGIKYVQVRNSPNNQNFQDVSFLSHFTVGAYEDIDIQYWNNPNGSGDHRIADIAKSCLVTNVTGSYVEFQLPSSNLNPDVRRDGNCRKSGWEYYSRFSEVVDRTSGWKEEITPDDCTDPGDENEKLKIRIFSSQQNQNQRGGGLRVKNITVNSDGESYTTDYYYNLPGSNENQNNTGYLSSGVTSYAPSIFNHEIPYIDLLPPPMVMYNYVTTVKNNHIRNTYEFKVLDAFTGLETGNYNLSDILKVNKVYSDVEVVDRGVSGGGDFHIFRDDFSIEDSRSSIGRLVSQSLFNSEQQLLSKTSYDYYTSQEMDITKESFKKFEAFYGHIGLNHAHWFANMSSTSKGEYPNILKSLNTVENGISTSTLYGGFDPITGIPKEETTTLSDGSIYKSLTIPAYSYYPQMGSKVYNSENKNMLSQEAINYALIDDNGTWKPIGVGINTWNNEWIYTNFNGIDEPLTTSVSEKIWRKEKTFIWDGDIDEQGFYIGYDMTTDDNFNWSINANNQASPWKKVSTITKYDHFSMPTEFMDINQNFATTKMTDESGKVLLTCDASHGEAFYTGVEYDNLSGPNYLDNGVFGKPFRTDEKSHTGTYSAKISPGGNSISTTFGAVMRAGKYRSGKYKMSVWVHKDNYSNIRFKEGYNGSLEVFNGETVNAGNWVQKNHYFEIDNNNTSNDKVFLVTSLNGDVYVDDFRIHPISSTMTSYVYNEFDELASMLSSNNLATNFQYDNSGRLIRIYEETVDTPTINGGFKLSKRYDYNYGREVISSGGGNNNDVHDVYFEILSTDDCEGPTNARLYGPPNSTIILQFAVNGVEHSYEATQTFGGTPHISNNYNFCGGLNQPVCSPTNVSVTIGLNSEYVDGNLYFYPQNGNCDGAATLTIVDVIYNGPGVAEIGSTSTILDANYGPCQGSNCDPGGGGGTGNGDPLVYNNSFWFYDSCTNNIVTYHGSINGSISGGSGNYGYTWTYRLTDPSTNISEIYNDFDNIDGASATKSFPTNSQYCGWAIEFICEVVDIDTGETIDPPPTSSNLTINCSCSPY